MIKDTDRARALEAWPAVDQLVRPPETEADYASLVETLRLLLDEVGDDKEHHLFTLLTIIGNNIEEYESNYHSMPDASPREVLKFLMDEHNLTQSDLPEVGSQGVVSEILSGKRELNIRQIKELARRFSVSPAVFID